MASAKKNVLSLALLLLLTAFASAEPKNYFNPNNDTQFGNEFNFESTSYFQIDAGNKNFSSRFVVDVAKTPSYAFFYLAYKADAAKTLMVKIETDSSGNPSGTAVCSGTYTSADKTAGLRAIPLSGCSALTANTAYHITIGCGENGNPCTASNYVRVYYVTSRDMASDSYVATKSGAGAWSQVSTSEPLALMNFTDATSYGTAYETTTYYYIEGTAQNLGYGEYFTVTGGDKVIKVVKMIGSCNSTTPRPQDALYLNITSGTTVLYSGTVVTANDCGTTDNVVAHTLTTPLILYNGSAYRILLTSPNSNSSSCYRILRESTGNVSPTATEGHYQQTNAQWTHANSSGMFNDCSNCDVFFNVTVGPRITIAQFRLYESTNTTNIGVGTLRCNTTSAYGNNLSDYNCSTTSDLAADTPHRAEILVCNDICGGVNASFYNLTHTNLPAYYLGQTTSGNCGHTDGAADLKSTQCTFQNTTEPLWVKVSNDSVKLNSSCTRGNTSCEWYAYIFNTSAPTSQEVGSTSITADSEAGGINASTGTITIAVNKSATGFTMTYPSTGCTAGQGNSSDPQLGICGAGECACDRCYFGPATVNDENVECQGQNAAGSVAFYEFTNTGTVTENWAVNLNATAPTNVVYKMGACRDNDPLNAYEIGTGSQNLCTVSVAGTEPVYAWADFSNPAAGNASRTLTHTSTAA